MEPTTFVLVHGAWGGSYGFGKLRPLLWSQGHEVFTPSLTGIGERSHLASPTIGLRTHVLDVVNTVLYEDLDNIVLLGFSYGGAVVTAALEHIGDRVDHLVFLDAIVPSHGQSVAGLLGWPERSTPEVGQQWFLPPIPRELPDPEATAWSNARRADQPIGTFAEAVHLERPLEEWPFSLTYIKASADAAEADDSHFWQMGRAAAESSRWAYHEIASTHLVAATHAPELASVLTALG